MAIIVNIDVMLAKRKMSVTELADKVGITMANISVLKNGKVKAIRLSTLDAICRALECQPGDILEYVESQKSRSSHPNVFLGNSAVAPFGNGHHAAAPLELADDTGPFPGPERDGVARDLRR